MINQTEQIQSDDFFNQLDSPDKTKTSFQAMMPQLLLPDVIPDRRSKSNLEPPTDFMNSDRKSVHSKVSMRSNNSNNPLMHRVNTHQHAKSVSNISVRSQKSEHNAFDGLPNDPLVLRKMVIDLQRAIFQQKQELITSQEKQVQMRG